MAASHLCWERKAAPVRTGKPTRRFQKDSATWTPFIESCWLFKIDRTSVTAVADEDNKHERASAHVEGNERPLRLTGSVACLNPTPVRFRKNNSKIDFEMALSASSRKSVAPKQGDVLRMYVKVGDPAAFVALFKNIFLFFTLTKQLF